MRTVRYLLILCACSVVLGLASASVNVRAASVAAPPPPPGALPNQSSPEEQEVEAAVRQALTVQNRALQLALLFDTQIGDIQISTDETWATAWMAPIDPDTGEIVPVEPGLAILQKVDGNWQTLLPSDPGWEDALQLVPGEILAEEQREVLFQAFDEAQASAINAPLTGYLLPWEGGKKMYLTQSVGHDRYRNDLQAHFSFDFATVYPSSRFPIVAAKASHVLKVRDDCEKEQDKACSNYLVLEDRSTNPVTYQLYLHLAPHSIPSEIRTIGTYVQQGQFIGIANNTGASSGNHLHYQVQSAVWGYWGPSVDIVFSDVSINGGRPRVATYDRSSCRSTDVCVEFSTSYISGNFPQGMDRTPPTGGITQPADAATLTAATVTLKGWARDDNSGISSAQFIALYDGFWQPVGDPITTTGTNVPLEVEWDLCANEVPDGPVSLALKVMDNAYNPAQGLPGLRHLTRLGQCAPPEPVCKPTSKQVALYAGVDFSGACVVLGTGDHNTTTELAPLGFNNAESVWVGAEVMVTLFDDDLRYRGETFTTHDRSLADNRVGANTANSARVLLRTAAPTTPKLLWPTSLSSALAVPGGLGFSVSLSADDTGGGVEFQAELNGELTGWQSSPVWSLTSLPTGSYVWRVRARNAGGTAGPWTGLSVFQVDSDGTPDSTPAGLPFTANMETGTGSWVNSSNWDLTDEVNHTTNGKNSWGYDTNSTNGYDTGIPHAGSLTSPPFQLLADSDYYLRFYYLYETEGPGVHWDQRWVQISVDNGPFTNVLQLSEDPKDYWLQSPAIPLAQYAGHSIRVRFHFETLDALLNTKKGWYIDDVTISATPPPDCADNNNTPATAQSIVYGDELPGSICPSGDLDYFKFTGKAGDLVGAYVAAEPLGSELDSVLSLFDQDGRSLLAFNDDQIPQELSDSSLYYRLPVTGDYYLQVRAWDHPNGGGETYPYQLGLLTDTDAPQVTFVSPRNGGVLASGIFTATLDVSDASSGVEHVELWIHSPDWQNGEWTLAGEDWDGQDGWGVPVTVPASSMKSGLALFAFASDRAGNRSGAGAWNLRFGVTGNEVYIPLLR